ncbi:hypothetical protein EIN_215020, partial [Entamoeba invadens IP1]
MLYLTVVEPITKGIALYSYGNAMWWVYKHKNELFLFVNGTEASDITFDFSQDFNDIDIYYNTPKYAATGYFKQISLNNNSNVKYYSICSKNNGRIQRYVFTTQTIEYQDCTCSSVDNNININFQTKFNYP